MIDYLDRSVASDEWQKFLDSPVWRTFISKRIYGEGGYSSNLAKQVASAVRAGDLGRSMYHQGLLDGVSKLVEIMSGYHKELEEQVK